MSNSNTLQRAGDCQKASNIPPCAILTPDVSTGKGHIRITAASPDETVCHAVSYMDYATACEFATQLILAMSTAFGDKLEKGGVR